MNLGSFDDSALGQVESHVAGEVEAPSEPDSLGYIEHGATSSLQMMNPIYSLLERPRVELLPISNASELSDGDHISPRLHRHRAGARHYLSHRRAIFMNSSEEEQAESKCIECSHDNRSPSMKKKKKEDGNVLCRTD